MMREQSSKRWFSNTAKATGNNIKVVAVLDIHILNMAEATINPITRDRALPPPKRLTMYRAMRLCAPDSAIALEIMKPPNSRRIRGLP